MCVRCYLLDQQYRCVTAQHHTSHWIQYTVFYVRYSPKSDALFECRLTPESCPLTRTLVKSLFHTMKLMYKHFAERFSQNCNKDKNLQWSNVIDNKVHLFYSVIILCCWRCYICFIDASFQCSLNFFLFVCWKSSDLCVCVCVQYVERRDNG